MKLTSLKAKSIQSAGLAIPLLIATLVLSGCGAAPVVVPPKPEPVAIPVKVQFASDSQTVSQDISYPGIVQAEQQADIIAKTNGTISNMDVKVGDHVSVGQMLAKVDDVNTQAATTDGFTANQVKQAELGVQQALASLNLAKNNYSNLLLSSRRDLDQLDISKLQAETAKSNLDLTTGENLKAAEIALQTANIAVEQARLAVQNRQVQANSGTSDAATNTDLVVTSAGDTAGSIIAALNSIAGLEADHGGSIIYHDTLGTLDSQSLQTAHAAYVDAKTTYDTYHAATYTDQTTRIAAVTELVNKVKKLVDASRNMFDHTLASQYLTQATLSGFQTQVAGYTQQINGVVSQLASVKQGQNNVALGNDASLDALNKAYELAQQQQKSAAQAVESLKAGNKSQLDQAALSITSMQNQIQNTSVKLNSQVSGGKSQVDLATIQYQNAVVALQSLVDAHQVIAPISGVVLKTNVNNGNTVSAGMPLATIGTADAVKVQFYVDQDTLGALALGQEVKLQGLQGASTTGVITSISPQADPATHRYLVDVHPQSMPADAFPLGSILNVTVAVRHTAAAGHLFLPLAAVDVLPNGRVVTVVKDGKASRVNVTVQHVDGEIADVIMDVSSTVPIVVDGNRLANEGDVVSIVK